MTTTQALNWGVRHDLSPLEIESLADALAAHPAGRKAAGRAIAKGKRSLSAEVRQAKAELCRERNRARAEKKNLKI